MLTLSAAFGAETFPVHLANGGATGMAVAISRDGMMVTDFRAVSGGRQEPLFVDLASGAIEAKVVGIDVVHDLALLKVATEFSDKFLTPLEDKSVEIMKSLAPTFSNSKWNSTVAAQVALAGDALTKKLLEYTLPLKEFKGWRTAPLPPDMKCTKVEGAEKCSPLSKISPEPGLETGFYEISFSDVHNSGLSKFSFFRRIGELYANQSEFAQSQYSSRKECFDRVVVNRKKTALKLDYCAVASLKYNGLFDAVVKIATFESSSDVLMITLQINGFQPESIKQMIDRLVQSVEKI